MRINDHLAASGDRLFRWRSFVLGIFVPFMAAAVLHGEAIELTYGEIAGRAVEDLALALVLVGLLVRVLTVGHVPARTSGRNTHGQVAEVLNTTGIYSVVRNPLYLGNAISYIGAVLYTQSLVLTLIMALVLVIYFERIIAAEEAFLADRFGTAYTDWAARTPAFFPDFRHWTPPALPFSLRAVIRREHPTWAGSVVLLYAIEMTSTWVEGESLADRPVWHAVLAAALVGQIVVMLLKRRTRLFAVAGR
ncbi:hypothetical protein HKCCSP123_15930 [Rhodobacterales bacterium HKCCSP123]|nr:hypothetical protein [Rhodobacterales bacterium HKCCSP123]